MAQAKIISITDSPRNDRHANAFRNMEGGLCNCVNMAAITVEHIESSLASIRRGMTLENDELERISFAVGHLEEMIIALKRDYYKEYGDQN